MPHRLEMLRIDAHRRQHARRIARMNARFFDVLLNAGDDTRRFISERIDIKLRGLLEKLVDQHRPLRRETDRRAHVVVERSPRRKRSPSRGRRAHSSDAPEPDNRFARQSRFASSTDSRHAVFRLRNSSSRSSAPKRLRSSARSIESGDVPMIGTPASCRRIARFRGVCPPNCTITPSGFSTSTMFITSSNVSGSK